MSFHFYFEFVLLTSVYGHVYYVSNSTNFIDGGSSCLVDHTSVHPCLPIDAVPTTFTQPGQVNASLYFIHENYRPSSNVSISFTDLDTVEIRSWREKSLVSIFCTDNLSFTFNKVHKVTIDKIQFYYCGKFMTVLTFSDTTSSIIADVTIANSCFMQCMLGAVKVHLHDIKLHIINSSFTDGMENYAVNITSHYAFCAFKKTNFINNTHGSIYFSVTSAESTLKVTESSFLNNTSSAVSTGALCIDGYPRIYIGECCFRDNYEGTILVANPAPLMSPQAIIVVNSSDFRNNSARSGGVLSIRYPYIIQVYNTTFINNSATTGDGGVVVFPDLYTRITPKIVEYLSTIYNSVFHSNSAPKGKGGVLSISFPSGMGGFSVFLLVNNSIFINNSARVGGALALQSSNTTLHTCVFIKNVATAEGGAVYVEGGITFQTNSCDVLNNTALRGGGIAVDDGNIMIISECNFDGNQATNTGGALSIEDKTEEFPAVLMANNFTNNEATMEGGAIKFWKIFLIKMVYNNFFNNTSNVGGALLAVTSTFGPKKIPMLILIQNIFDYNKANIRGGALASEGYGIELENSAMRWNEARYSGGAIYIKHGARALFQGYFWGELRIISSVLTDNIAGVGGALSMTTTGSTIYLNSSSFVDNEAKLKGGALWLNISSPTADLIIKKCKFFRNYVTDQLGSGGALVRWNQFANTVFSEFDHKLKIDSSEFVGNEASFGGALFVFNTSVIVDDCNFTSNSAHFGGAVCANFSQLCIGNVAVHGNVAREQGGGFSLNVSNMTFHGTAELSNNNVTSMSGKGESIYINDRPEDCSVDSCLLSWSVNASMDFTTGNTAGMRSVIYGGMVDRCHKSKLNKTLQSQLDAISLNGLKYNKTSRAITSESVKICYCKYNTADCKMREIEQKISPGQTMYLHIACVDQMDHPNACFIRSEYIGTAFQLGQGQNFRYISNCQQVAYNAYSKEKNSSTLVIQGEILCNERRWNSLQAHVTIGQCPTGFELVEDRCQCDHRLHDIFVSIKCDIDTGLITLKQLGWFSYGGHHLRVHDNCPLNYCILTKNGTSPTESDALCDNNHRGILCGGCVSNDSIILGSWKCRDCSHLSRFNIIWLTIILSLAGLALVVFLLLLKLTVSSGTMNGLIVYANILSLGGLLDYQSCSVHPILRVFLSWINLDLGIEICFYSGMDVYQKTWLQFVFPVYVWSIVAAIIVLCKHSVRVMRLMGMRNIEVLATLFLLSYAKLLKTIATSFSYTDILVGSAKNVSNALVPNRVWLYDGNIDFLDSRHLPLFVVAMLLFLLLFLPYTLLLLFGQCLRSLQRRRILKWTRNIYFVYFIDAYHAPYSKHHRYWTGLGLLIRCVLFTIFGTSYSIHSNFLWIIFAVAFLLVVRACSGGSIYNHKAVDLLELSFIINLGLLATLLHHNSAYCEALNISTWVAFASFTCIMIFHLHVEMKKKLKVYEILLQRIVNIFISKSVEDDDADQIPVEKENDHHHQTTYINLRESLLS